MYIELIALILLGVFILVFVSTAFLEKQHIKDFIPSPVENGTPESPYFLAMNDFARRLGFTKAGVFVQNRGSRIYQARLALWISSDRQSLLRIGGGKTAGVPIKRSVLTSFVEPNRIIETSDDFGMADISGLTDFKVILNADLDELNLAHEKRLAECTGEKRSFLETDALVASEAIRAIRATEMEKLGFAKFISADRTVWRHTLKGALASYFKGFRAQLAQGKAQSDRIHLKRPGQK